ncbi:PREDICTED: protein LSM12 homolog [Acropora digitifera]|uniref:protein LSM12 homolog n=1 Tax=Acropora digitifera TaxID=70779 RepID=UPI00077AF59E|nr:PREDICTED: protein LSM12 homolog [Acropora digitifera]
MASGDAKDGKEIPPGTKVVCITCFDEKIEGEVLAFDYGTKVLIIKSSKNTKKNAVDVKMLNMSHMRNIEVTELPTKPAPSLRSLDPEKVEKKINIALNNKRRAVDKIGINVTPRAQRLFDTINKTFKEVEWNDKTIVVMDDVKIEPPYEEDNCSGSEQSLEHIIKIVRKHNQEENNGPG